MSSDPAAPGRPALRATAGGASPGGRLAVLTGFAFMAASVPVPLLPDRLLLRIRGAVVHDVVARHGLSLTSDARLVLAGAGGEQPMLRRALETVAIELLRRLRRVGAVAAVARGLEVYALGYLLERYIMSVRPTGVVRIHADEARRIRDLIERSIKRALSPELRAGTTLLPSGAEDLRDEFTRWIDALLLTGAALPGYLEGRLDAAFDAVVVAGVAHG